MKIKQNPDTDYANKIHRAVIANNGYCPCKLEKTPDTKCPCKEFLEGEDGLCHCGLYIMCREGD